MAAGSNATKTKMNIERKDELVLKLNAQNKVKEKQKLKEELLKGS